MKQGLKNPVNRVDHTKDPSPANKAHKSRKPVWKVLIFFVPLPGAGGFPKPPGNKNWLETVILILKVLAAVAALWKAVGWAV